MTTGKTSFDVLGQLGALRRYAMSLVRSPDEAEDLVHDALVRAYEKQGTFRNGGNLRSWLMSILHNAHVDRLRRGRSRLVRETAVADLAPEAMAAPQDLSVRLRQLRERFSRCPKTSGRPCISSRSKTCPIRKPPMRSAFPWAR